MWDQWAHKLPVDKARKSYLECCTIQVILMRVMKGHHQCWQNIRPEKEHSTQLLAFGRLLANHPDMKNGPLAIKLVLVGGCRNKEDRARVDSLRSLAKELDILVRWRVFDVNPSRWKSWLIDSAYLPSGQGNVEFVVNASHSTILSWLSRAGIGLSTMIDEHFGINVVEFLVGSFLSTQDW